MRLLKRVVSRLVYLFYVTLLISVVLFSHLQATMFFKTSKSFKKYNNSQGSISDVFYVVDKEKLR